VYAIAGIIDMSHCISLLSLKFTFILNYSLHTIRTYITEFHFVCTYKPV
jgi:hypothetical protein